MKLSNKITVAAALTILVLAVALLVYGITTHSEPGLMRVCWRGGSVSSYRCRLGEDLVWDRSQVPVSVATDGLIGETQTSIDLINSQVGCDILEYVGDNDPSPDVTVISEAAMSPGTGRGGATVHVRDASGMRARIELYAVGDMATRVIVHELGHTLGLDHDSDRSSIMYPRQTESSDLQFIMLTQSDRQTLRELYCRR